MKGSKFCCVPPLTSKNGTEKYSPQIISLQNKQIHPQKLTYLLKINGWKMKFPFEMIPFLGMKNPPEVTNRMPKNSPWFLGLRVPKKSKSHQIGIQVGWKTDTSHDWFLVWNNCYIICYQNIPSFTKHVPIRIYTIGKSCTFWTPKVMGLVDWNMIFQIANGWCLSKPSQMGPISLPNSTTFGVPNLLWGSL